MEGTGIDRCKAEKRDRAVVGGKGDASGSMSKGAEEWEKKGCNRNVGWIPESNPAGGSRMMSQKGGEGW